MASNPIRLETSQQLEDLSNSETALENVLQEIVNDASQKPFDYNKQIENPGGGE